MACMESSYKYEDEQQPYRGHTYYPISLSLHPDKVILVPGCHRMKSSFWELPNTLAIFGQYASNLPNTLSPNLLQDLIGNE